MKYTIKKEREHAGCLGNVSVFPGDCDGNDVWIDAADYRPLTTLGWDETQLAALAVLIRHLGLMGDVKIEVAR